jgi:hypothetical protein
MYFCDLCNGLTIANLSAPNFYRHGENLAAVEQSAKTCQLCKLIHWCLWLNSECDGSPELHFEGALEEQTAYGDNEARNQCSIKLQIVVVENNQMKHIGIWMLSKFMISDITLAVEEGTATVFEDRLSALTTMMQVTNWGRRH